MTYVSIEQYIARHDELHKFKSLDELSCGACSDKSLSIQGLIDRGQSAKQAWFEISQNDEATKNVLELIDRGKPTYGMGFEGGTGTADMAKRLEIAGIPMFNAGYLK